MLLLAAGKRLTGKRLQNIVLQTEARVILVDANLAGSVFLGLVSNAIFGCTTAICSATIH